MDLRHKNDYSFTEVKIILITNQNCKIVKWTYKNWAQFQKIAQIAPKSVFRGILHSMNLEKKFAIIDYGQSFSLIESPQN